MVVMALYLQRCSCKNTCSRKRSARTPGCPCQNAGKKCSDQCTCGTKKSACRNKAENVVVNRNPSAYARHREAVDNAETEIKVWNHSVVLSWIKASAVSYLRKHFIIGVYQHSHSRKERLATHQIAQSRTRKRAIRQKYFARRRGPRPWRAKRLGDCTLVCLSCLPTDGSGNGECVL